MPLSKCRFPVLELNTDAGPEVSKESPFIPTTPRLVESSGPTVELAGPRVLMEGGAGMLSR